MYGSTNKGVGLLILLGIVWISALFMLTATGMESAFQAQKKDETKAEEIIKQAQALLNQKNYDEALRLLESAILQIEKEFGENHVIVARGLNILGLGYRAKRQFKEAEASLKIAISIWEKAELPNPRETAESLYNLANLYRDTGRYAEAESLHKRSLEIREQELGPTDPDVAKSLIDLAQVYIKTGRYSEGEALNKRALEIREKAFGSEHPSVAVPINNLAAIYYGTGRYEEAAQLFKRALEIWEKALGPEHPDVAKSLNNLALVYRMMGKYSETEPLYKRALEIKEKALGPEHPDLASTMHNLAVVYFDKGKYSEAEHLYKRALDILEKAFGPEHPDIATPLLGLAGFYWQLGRYSEAEPLSRRALAIHEKTLGPEHPSIADHLDGLALIYLNTGRYSEAEPLCRRALEIREKALGPEHPDIAYSLNGLAGLYLHMARYSEAEALYKRALEIREKAQGPEHPNVANQLTSLAELYSDTARLSEAEPIFKRALEILEKALGPEHPDVAYPLYGLAKLFLKTSRYSEAESLYRRTLGILEKAQGPEHPNVAKSLLSLAFLYARTGKQHAAHVNFVRCLEAQALHRKRVLNGLSERQQLAFVQTQHAQTHNMLSYVLQYMRGDARAVQDAMNIWLKWKGVVLEAQSRYMAMVMQSQDPEIQANWQELQEVRQHIARLIMAGQDKLKLTPEAYQGRLRELANEAEELEQALSRKSAPFALEQRIGLVDAGRLAGAVGTDGAYVDFAKVSMFDFLNDKPAEDHYGVFVLVPQQAGRFNVHLLDLGKAQEIARMIQMWRKHIAAADTGKTLKVGKELYSRIFKPAEQWLKGKKRLVVSLDGELHLLPMEALALGANQKGKETYVMDRWEVVYVPAGRDIVRWEEPATGSRAAVVMADPDYNLGPDKKIKVVNQLKLPSVAQGERPIVRGGVSEDLQAMKFERLEGTQEEGRQVKKALTGEGYDVKLCLGEQAIEEVLQSLSGPRLVHLATHGFFLAMERPGLSEQVGEKPLASLLREGEGWSELVGVQGEHPLLRSGIALAGANSSLAEGRDEGILHGIKVQGLKLWGTDLVMLSACETGLGVIQAGEGVFGLQRSFILAGARTLVASLWKVDDKATSLFMSEFYKAWTGGASKVKALAKARRAVRNHPDHPEWRAPFYWAAFILVGAPD